MKHSAHCHGSTNKMLGKFANALSIDRWPNEPDPLLLFRYAGADNGEDNIHFITRFRHLLSKEHDAVTGPELKTFFDTKVIEEDEHLKTRLEDNELEPSRSHNSITSPEHGFSGKILVSVSRQVNGESENA